MAIPDEIRKIKRPTNTVVVAYGKGKDKYAVRQRIGCKRVNGRNVPVTGPTIGHIVGGAFVRSKELAGDSPDLKDWANVAYCDSLFRDVIGDLDAHYDHGVSLQIYCVAVLRVCYPGVKDCELKERYDSSFLSEAYPGVALSRNTVSGLFALLGKNISRIVAFMRKRVEAFGVGDHLLVDGTLKSDESSVNSLSDFSRKARTKGSRDISVLYAFDLERREPVCSQCFPGNMLDLTAYSDFIERNGIKKGIIVADKGFPSSAAAGEFAANPDLHFLNPVKRNSKLAETHSMYSYTGTLKGREGILCKKAKVSGKDRWLYSFRDQRKASKEEADYIRRSAEGGYDDGDFKRRQATFGTVILESDLNLTPEEVYLAYSKRWEIELVMRYYKQACELDETRVHSDYSVHGSEFASFLASVLTYRILNDAEKKKALEKLTYGKVMAKLERAKKIRLNGEWRMVRINPSEEALLVDLGILEKPAKAPKKGPGRPKKNAI